MKRLLNKPLRSFAIYSLIILLVSIPMYVLVIDYIWLTELDENNWLTLEHTIEKLESNTYSSEEIELMNRLWSELQPGLSIVPIESKAPFPDSVYQVIRPNAYDIDDEEDRFRGLKRHVLINDTPYALTIETNVEETDETFVAVALITLFFFVVLIIGFVMLNRKIAIQAWRPFYETLTRLKSFELSKDQSLVLPASNIFEFHELNQSLERLIQNNVETYKIQKSFTENASHELQTPIALLKAKLDLLLQQQELTPAVSELIASIEAPLSRLSRINKNLLVLAKVGSHQYDHVEVVNVKEILQDSLVLFDDYVSNKKLKLSVKTQSTRVSANIYLLETLLHNLISNAIRYTELGGQIHIDVIEGVLQISNSGVSALNEDQMFDRFSSLTNQKVSSGLGLAIIKEIVTKYDWNVDYSFDAGMHHFSVKFD
ncbi:sensor histidine kinase [Marinoscillum pacificum]|uniref:sensor histidine kinase n=1 Tax=Marinoscillum pacificum TaxID=392723 RepID=UPI0021587E6F|nr:HAMP domain-containing sensor histidine kinase [Marinoscillum pacificum]